VMCSGIDGSAEPIDSLASQKADDEGLKTLT